MRTIHTTKDIHKLTERVEVAVADDLQFEALPEARIVDNAAYKLDNDTTPYRVLALRPEEGSWRPNILIRAEPQAWGRADMAYAHRILDAIRRRNHLDTNDLTYAFETSGAFPGLQLIAGTPAGTPFEGTILLTKAREFLYVIDTPEEQPNA